MFINCFFFPGTTGDISVVVYKTYNAYAHYCTEVKKCKAFYKIFTGKTQVL